MPRLPADNARVAALLEPAQRGCKVIEARNRKLQDPKLAALS